MQETLRIIAGRHRSLLGDHPEIEKIHVGFTNTLYRINDCFILKICADRKNEERFKKEIQFYHAFKNSGCIPRLYYADTGRDAVPYCYEILEKIPGVTVYDVWHTFDERQREEIIKQLCRAMKLFHRHTGAGYDWGKKTSGLFSVFCRQAESLDLFREDEMKLLNKARSGFDALLRSDEFALVHNDLHFDNVLWHQGKIWLIDFERSLYAPKDFELDILYRMARKPWKFASEENEKYTKKSDYANIMTYIEKYYPELIHTDHLYKRLAIYDMVYFLRQYADHPEDEALKEDVLSAARLVIGE